MMLEKKQEFVMDVMRDGVEGLAKDKQHPLLSPCPLSQSSHPRRVIGQAFLFHKSMLTNPND